MAVTGHSRQTAALLLGLMAALVMPLRADDSAEIHTLLGNVATAISSSDAALAMSGFSKSYSDYSKLSSYFDALSGAYLVESRVDFTEEEIGASTATVTVHWEVTLTTRQSGFTKNRSSDINVKLAREGKHWRIVAFGPIEIFDPAG